MKRTGTKLHFLLLPILLAAVLAGILFPALFPRVRASAEESAYSSVLDDLKQDKTFHASAYPAKKTDYSLQVIQIAESTDGEVLVYVYQPCAVTKQLKATTINISTAIGENLSYKNYKLDYLNGSGVFAKYRVDGLSVKADAVRYYDISAIFRAWNEEIDAPAAGASANGNTVQEVSYAVGKLYTASTLNGEVSYSALGTETITITDKYCGFVRYYGGYAPMGWNFNCDSWYVAFSTDRKIDTLMEADVYYVSQRYLHSAVHDSESPKEDNYITVKYTDVAQSTNAGVFSRVYTWNRIQSIADFTEKEDLNDATKKGLQGKQWVLRFAETDFDRNTVWGSTTEMGTRVSEVTILRLKFETNGKVYNLGVVDNKQSAGLTADNERGDGLTWWQILLIVIAVIVVLALLCSLIKPLANIVLFVLKAVWTVVTLPFRAIAAIVKAIKNRKGKGE